MIKIDEEFIKKLEKKISLLELNIAQLEYKKQEMKKELKNIKQIKDKYIKTGIIYC